MPATDPVPGSELNKALAAVQADLPAIAKGAKAIIPGRDGRPGYDYDYADLADVSAAILPLLGKNGLAFTAWPTLDDGKFVLAYALIHESGEERTGVYPLPSSGTPQQVGGVITYARRYCLCAVTGVAPGGEDNDAADAPEVHMDRARAPQPPAERSGRATRQVPGGDMWDEIRSEERPGSADPADLRAIHAAYYTKLGFDERTDALKVAHTSEQLVGRALSGPHKGKTHKNLTWGEARKLRADLAGFNGDRGALLARLAGITQDTDAGAAQDAAETTQEVPS